MRSRCHLKFVQNIPTTVVNPKMSRRRLPNEEVPLNFATSYNLRGPAYVKLLLPDKVSGSVIGRGGQVLQEFEQKSGALIKVSPSRTYFPTTNERMVMITGDIGSLRIVIPLVMTKMKEHGMEPDSMMIRLTVPNSSIPSIIGKGGEIVKSIQGRTGAHLHLCERIEGLQETILELKGSELQVESATNEVMDIIQQDPRLKDLAGQYYGMSGPPQQAQMVPPADYGYPPQEFQRGFAPVHRDDFRDYQYDRQPSPLAPMNQGMVPDPTSNPALLTFPITIQFVVPPSAVPYIVGENGMSIGQYFRQTGATVQVDPPQPESQDINVSISGPLCGVQAAHILVIKQVTEAILAANPPRY